MPKTEKKRKWKIFNKKKIILSIVKPIYYLNIKLFFFFNEYLLINKLFFKLLLTSAIPGAPGGPGGPWIPGAPSKPGSPLLPCKPSGPGEPGSPLSPRSPIGPGAPRSPGTPVAPYF